MKKILVISLLLLAAACREKSVIPDGTGYPAEETVSIAFLKTLYKGAPVRIVGEYRISGNVVSSDAQGNFYKTLVLDDGTSGIEVKLDMEQIFKTFGIHGRVMVRCNGLWLGSYGGTLQLGDEPYEGYQTQYIPKTAIAGHLLRDNEFHEEVFPRKLTVAQIVPTYISTSAKFDGVQFIDEELGLGWSEANADTDRHAIDTAGDTLTVRTSRHALFASDLLPKGSGAISGVLGYFNGTYQLVLCDERGAEMENPRF